MGGLPLRRLLLAAIDRPPPRRVARRDLAEPPPEIGLHDRGAVERGTLVGSRPGLPQVAPGSHAHVAIRTHRRERLERQCRYLVRPPLALARLTETSGGPAPSASRLTARGASAARFPTRLSASTTGFVRRQSRAGLRR